MKSLPISLICAAALSLAAVSCDDTSSVGNILDDGTVAIVIDSNFTVTGTTQANPVVQSRTISQLLGSIEAPVFGSIYSDFVAQFMPSKKIDTVNMKAENIDSVRLFLQTSLTGYVGDSLVPMGYEVYRLNRDLPYPIYSDFNPADYYDHTPLASGIYTASIANEPDSIKKMGLLALTTRLPVELGREIYNAYMDSPSTFNDPSQFINKVFKGLYIRSNYGSGRVTDYISTSIRLYYHKDVYNTDSARWETVRYAGDYLAVTPEVVVNNNIRYTPGAELKKMIAEGKQIIAAPAGYELDMEFPARELVASYNRYKDNLRVLTSLTFSVPVDSIANRYGITPPPYALLILKNKKADFFAKNSLTDNRTSFYATYDAVNGRYMFSGMRGYMQYLLGLDEITADDYTFTLVPVQVNREQGASTGSYYYPTQSQVVTSIVPYVSTPAMGLIRLEDAKIRLAFSASSEKNL